MSVLRDGSAQPHYGTWIRARAIFVFGALAAVSLALSMFALVIPWALLLLIPACAFGWIFLVLGLARFRFSDSGGRYQARIHGLLESRVRGSHVLDIGCGNGHLAIQLAKADPSRRVTGLDYWGSAWEYSKQICERNARLEAVGDRVTFVQGSAAALPFPDAEFDCVVSCLTFHEVRDLPDKTLALAEALRVLRPGGSFVFLDLFSDPGAYPGQQLITDRLGNNGAFGTVDTSLSSLLPLPFPLKGKRLLEHARLISGERHSDSKHRF